ncbi:MAG: trypsin-like peptidase domain-containing protein [Chloroflexota bacterium]
MAGSDHLEREMIQKILPTVVQVVALQKGFFGNLSSAWTGSATCIDPRGYFLTNCHVANPRAMGMPSPAANALAIAVLERSDEPPVLTYYVDIVNYAAELDLAVLKISKRIDGKSIRGLKLPYLPVGDSDYIELGDFLSIFGFPGIGGDTVTFTSGNVSGFTKERGVRARRAWIKTDATIAGGNSGGTAVDLDGRLVGIPTQAAAGTGITPVDARPVVDTNRDGRVDQRDSPIAVGGFINGLRPVNLAFPLLQQAGVKLSKKMPKTTHVHDTPKQNAKVTDKSSSAKFSNMVFSKGVTKDGRPIGPAEIFPRGSKQVFASVDFDGMRNGTKWSQNWSVNGKIISNQEAKWQSGPRGRMVLAFGNQQAMPEGTYHLAVVVKGAIVIEGDFAVGRRQDDHDTQLSGAVVDQGTGRGISDALVIALNPNVSAMDFARQQRQDMAFTSAKTDRSGKFTFAKQLPKGQAYGLVVVARGYRDMVIEGGIRLAPNTPEKAQMMPLGLIRG